MAGDYLGPGAVPGSIRYRYPDGTEAELPEEEAMSEAGMSFEDWSASLGGQEEQPNFPWLPQEPDMGAYAGAPQDPPAPVPAQPMAPEGPPQGVGADFVENGPGPASDPFAPDQPPVAQPQQPQMRRVSEGQAYSRSGVRKHKYPGFDYGYQTMSEEDIPDPNPTYQGYGEAAAMEAQALNEYEAAYDAYEAGQDEIWQQKAEQSDLHQDRMKASDEYIKRKVARYENELDAAVRAVPTMDRSRIWKNTSTGLQAIGLLSAALEGFLNPGQESSTVKLAMDMVNQDMEAQRSEIDSAWRNVDTVERGNARKVDQLYRERQQMKEGYLLRMADLDSALAQKQAKLQSKFSKMGIEKQRAEIQRSMTAVRHDLVKEEFNNRKMVVDQANQAMSLHNQTVNMDQGRRIQRASFSESRRHNKAMEDAASAKARQAQLGKGIASVQMPDGSRKVLYVDPNIELSAEQQSKVQTRITSARNFAGAANKLIGLVERHKRGLTPSERAEFQAQMDEAISALRPELGANLPEAEAKRAESRLGSANSILKNPETTLKILRRGITSAGTRMNTELNQYGVRTYDQAPDGTIVGNYATQDDLWKDEFTPAEHKDVIKKTNDDHLKVVDAVLPSLQVGGNEVDREDYNGAVSSILSNLEETDGSDFYVQEAQRVIDKLNQLDPESRAIVYNGQIQDPVHLLREATTPTFEREMIKQQQGKAATQRAKEVNKELPEFGSF